MFGRLYFFVKTKENKTKIVCVREHISRASLGPYKWFSLCSGAMNDCHFTLYIVPYFLKTEPTPCIIIRKILYIHIIIPVYVYIYPHTSGGDIGTTSRRVFMTNFGAPTDKTGGYLHYSVPSPDSSRFTSLSRPAGCLSRSSLHPGHVPPGFPLLWPFSTESMPQATSLVSYMSNASVMRSG